MMPATIPRISDNNGKYFTGNHSSFFVSCTRPMITATTTTSVISIILSTSYKHFDYVQYEHDKRNDPAAPVADGFTYAVPFVFLRLTFDFSQLNFRNFLS